jgi:hypothetical protein
MSRHTHTDVVPRRADRRTSTAVVAAAISLGLVASGVLVWRGTEAVFTATTGNPANSWNTGSVTLTDSDAGTALFSLTNLAPGVGADRCINVTYGGTLTPQAVKLYASGYTNSADASLGTNILLTITEGAGVTPAAPDCTGFVADGAATYSGTLGGFGAKTTYAAGVGAWVPTTNAKVRTYRIGYEVLSTAGQGQTAGLTFVWETQS